MAFKYSLPGIVHPSRGIRSYREQSHAHRRGNTLHLMDGGMAFPFSIGSRTNPSQETSVLRFGQFRPSENRTDNTQLSETGPARTGKDERGKSWKRQD